MNVCVCACATHTFATIWRYEAVHPRWPFNFLNSFIYDCLDDVLASLYFCIFALAYTHSICVAIFIYNYR